MPKTEAYRDRRGIAFADRHLLLPARVDMWPKYPPRVKKDEAGLQHDFHGEFGRWACWLCGIGPEWSPSGEQLIVLQLHHLAGGSRGRSHERELFTMLDARCHANITKADLGKLLWCKWKFDREWTDWEWLAVRHGHHLPALVNREGEIVCE